MKVLLKTNKGDITLTLDPEAAPATCDNFKQYVEDGHFDNTIFHRVIPGFMIQGGGFTADMQQKSTRATISNEANNGLKNVVGSVAMARTPDPHSASSQFFINVNDNDFLNFRAETGDGWGYCVFGQTTEGLETVHAIAGVSTRNHGPHADVPVEPVIIESASLLDD